MFHLTYTARELRRRLGRTLLTALGLALGVGLVIAIIGVSQGLDDAQDEVLAPLQSVGTDILVTRVVGDTSGQSDQSGQSGQADPAAPQAGPGFFGPGARGSALNREDVDALLDENRNVVTDLSKLGNPGDTFTHDFFLSSTLLSFPEDAIDQIADLPGVASATGGLVQLVQHQTGTVPEIVASIQTGGETITQTVRPDPMTDDERAAFRQCLADKGVTVGGGPTEGGGEGGRVEGPGPGGGPDAAPAPNPAFDECLPQRFREFRASFTTPLQTIQQVVNPPSTDISTQSYTAAGVDPATPGAGLVTKDQLSDGRWIAKDAPNEVLVSVAYASTKDLKVGSKLPINGTDYEVVGLVTPTLTGSTADVYFPLATLQSLAGKSGRVTQVLVKADGSASVEDVAKRIEALMPGAEVVTTAELADQVTGSLADAQQLASRLGGALAAIVLGAAFAIAVLLTLSSIAKRVREIGTLRAIGWSKARVVRQLLGETVGIGALGGLLGIGIGAALAAAVGAFSPSLSATTSGIPGIAGSSLSGLFGQATSTLHTSEVSLTAPLHPATFALGIAFAVVGGLLAGLAGGWRAARLAPAVSLRDLG